MTGHLPGPMGRVILVGGGPGAPDLITVRGLRALHAADVVIADRLGPTALLADLDPRVPVIDVGKAPGRHPVPQEQINALLVEHARAGRVVVRLKGGDPYLLGRGGEEVLACRAAGVPVEVVPGVTSALSVPAAAGIPVTHRGTAATLHVVSGQGACGQGANGKSARASGAALAEGDIALLRERRGTVVLLMGVASLPEVAAAALMAGAPADTPVAVVERGTLPDQRVTRLTLADLVTGDCCTDVRAPAVVVLGEVAAMDLTCSEPAAAPTSTLPSDRAPARSTRVPHVGGRSVRATARRRGLVPR